MENVKMIKCVESGLIYHLILTRALRGGPDMVTTATITTATTNTTLTYFHRLQ